MVYKSPETSSDCSLTPSVEMLTTKGSSSGMFSEPRTSPAGTRQAFLPRLEAHRARGVPESYKYSPLAAFSVPVTSEGG